MPPSLRVVTPSGEKSVDGRDLGSHFCVSGKCCWSSPLEHSCLELFVGRTLCSELNTALSSPRILLGTPGPKSSQSSDGPRAGEEIQIPKSSLSLSVDPAGGSRGRVTFRSEARENMQWALVH